MKVFKRLILNLLCLNLIIGMAHADKKSQMPVTGKVHPDLNFQIEPISKDQLDLIKQRINVLSNRSIINTQSIDTSMPGYQIAIKRLEREISKSIYNYVDGLDQIDHEIRVLFSQLDALYKTNAATARKQEILEKHVARQRAKLIPRVQKKIQSIYHKAIKNLYTIDGQFNVNVSRRKNQLKKKLNKSQFQLNTIFSACETRVCVEFIADDIREYFSFVEYINKTIKFSELDEFIHSENATYTATPMIANAMQRMAGDIASFSMTKNKEYSRGGLALKYAKDVIVDLPTAGTIAVLSLPVAAFENIFKTKTRHKSGITLISLHLNKLTSVYPAKNIQESLLNTAEDYMEEKDLDGFKYTYGLQSTDEESELNRLTASLEDKSNTNFDKLFTNSAQENKALRKQKKDNIKKKLTIKKLPKITFDLVKDLGSSFRSNVKDVCNGITENIQGFYHHSTATLISSSLKKGKCTIKIDSVHLTNPAGLKYNLITNYRNESLESDVSFRIKNPVSGKASKICDYSRQQTTKFLSKGAGVDISITEGGYSYYSSSSEFNDCRLEIKSVEKLKRNYFLAPLKVDFSLVRSETNHYGAHFACRGLFEEFGNIFETKLSFRADYNNVDCNWNKNVISVANLYDIDDFEIKENVKIKLENTCYDYNFLGGCSKDLEDINEKICEEMIPTILKDFSKKKLRETINVSASADDHGDYTYCTIRVNK